MTHSGKKSLLQNAFVRAIIGLIVIYAVNMGVLTILMKTHFFDEHLTTLFANLVSSALTVVAYIFLFKWLEKREVHEFAFKGMVKNLALGFAVGLLLQSLTILVIYIFGGYQIVSFNSWYHLIIPFGLSMSYAIGEEIIFRGVIFRIMQEKLGTYLALLISAGIFGGLHIFNPDSSWEASMAIAIQAGLLLGIAYVYSKGLWLPIAIHFAWDFSESAIFGAKLSGTSSPTLVNATFTGAEWLTGGGFGPEASAQAIVICLSASAIFLYLCHKQDKIIRPFWFK